MNGVDITNRLSDVSTGSGDIFVNTASITNVSCVNASISSLTGINACFSNNLYVMGSIYAGYTVTGYSDERVKIKTQNLSQCLSKICNLSTFQYYPNTSLFKEYDIPFVNESEIGLSAQELLPIFPEVVCPAPCDILIDNNTNQPYSKTGLNLLTVKYERLVPVLVQAIQELTSKVKIIERKLITIEQQCSIRYQH